MKKPRLLKLIVAVSLSWPIGLFGQTAQRCVVVETTQGEKMEFLLMEEPRLVHNDATVILTTSLTTIEFNTADIVKVYLSNQDNNTGLKSVTETRGKIDLVGNSVLFSGFKPNERVDVYDMDGRAVQHLTVGDDGCLVFPLSQVAHGCYILTINHQSIKILKK
jgi:hypothetical protein